MTAPVTAPPGGPAVRSPRREIPRQAEDYTAAAAQRRLAFLAETTGVTPEHLGRYSFDPAVLDGNIERSSRPPCSAARSRWARPWWPTNGSPRTNGSAGTAPRRKSCHPRWTG